MNMMVSAAAMAATVSQVRASVTPSEDDPVFAAIEAHKSADDRVQEAMAEIKRLERLADEAVGPQS